MHVMENLMCPREATAGILTQREGVTEVSDPCRAKFHHQVLPNLKSHREGIWAIPDKEKCSSSISLVVAKKNQKKTKTVLRRV